MIICDDLHTLSAGLVENLSLRTPFSSKRMTTRSVVHTAKRLPLGAQHTAVTLEIPGVGGVNDSINLRCMIAFYVRHTALMIWTEIRRPHRKSSLQINNKPQMNMYPSRNESMIYKKYLALATTTNSTHPNASSYYFKRKTSFAHTEEHNRYLLSEGWTPRHPNIPKPL